MINSNPTPNAHHSPPNLTPTSKSLTPNQSPKPIKIVASMVLSIDILSMRYFVKIRKIIWCKGLYYFFQALSVCFILISRYKTLNLHYNLIKVILIIIIIKRQYCNTNTYVFYTLGGQLILYIIVLRDYMLYLISVPLSLHRIKSGISLEGVFFPESCRNTFYTSRTQTKIYK